jgi:hypothetical protein
VTSGVASAPGGLAAAMLGAEPANAGPMAGEVDPLPGPGGLEPGLDSAGGGAAGVVEPSVADPDAAAGALSGGLSTVGGGLRWGVGDAPSPAGMAGRPPGPWPEGIEPSIRCA